MAQEITLKQKCVGCGGTGVQPSGLGNLTCSWQDCNGTGFMTFGKFIMEPGTEELQDKHQDIMDKLNDIIELLQP